MPNHAIHKYAITASRQKINLPVGYKLLTVQLQNGTPHVWAVIDKAVPVTTPVIFHVVGTGWIFDSTGMDCIDTFQSHESGFVFHVFVEQE